MDGIVLGSNDNTNQTNFSEIICASNDTRALGLVTLEPSANGNTYNWTNTYINVNETTLDDATFISAANNGDIAQFTVNNSRVGVVSAIAAVVISARIKRTTGLQNAQLGVRTNNIDYWSANQNIGTSYNPRQYVFTSNPGTSANWLDSQINNAGFNIGLKATT